MGSTHSSPFRKDPPALRDACDELATRERKERTPGSDAHLTAEDQQQSSRHERDVGSCKPAVQQRQAPLYEEISVSSSHSSFLKPACDTYHPLRAEQDSVVLSQDYELLSEKMKLTLQQLDAEKQKNLQMSRSMEASTQEWRNLLNALGCETLEAIYHKFHSQKTMADSGSYQDSAATPPLLQLAADGVKDAITVCASELFSGYKKNANLVSSFVQLDLPIEQTGPAQVKVALQALLCRILFKGFEDPYFCIGDGSTLLAPFEIPSKRKSQLFEAFRRCRDTAARQLLDEDNDFKLFVNAKAYEVSAEIKMRLPSAINAQESIDQLELINNTDSVLCLKFLRLAKMIWVLHELVLAFEPSAEIFHVAQGSFFNEDFMEDLAHDADTEDYELSMAGVQPQKQVGFMCVPGFTVRHTVIKSRVFCLPAVPP